jgi:hypothetical protein
MWSCKISNTKLPFLDDIQSLCAPAQKDSMVNTRSSRRHPTPESPAVAAAPAAAVAAAPAPVEEETIPKGVVMGLLSEQLAIYSRQGWVDITDTVYEDVNRAKFNLLVVKQVLLPKKSYGR